MAGGICMLNEEKKWKNCYEFYNLTWINQQFIKFVKKDEHIELQINLEGIESLSQNIRKLSRTQKNRILYLGNADWGNGRFVNYTPFWYLDKGSIKVTILKLLGNAEVLNAEYVESENGDLSEIYFEGTRKGLEKLIKVLFNTKDTNQQTIINSACDNNFSFLLTTILVNCKGRVH